MVYFKGTVSRKIWRDEGMYFIYIPGLLLTGFQIGIGIGRTVLLSASLTLRTGIKGQIRKM
jgi:hypothetical protein